MNEENRKKIHITLPEDEEVYIDVGEGGEISITTIPEDEEYYSEDEEYYQEDEENGGFGTLGGIIGFIILIIILIFIGSICLY